MIRINHCNQGGRVESGEAIEAATGLIPKG